MPCWAYFAHINKSGDYTSLSFICLGSKNYQFIATRGVCVPEQFVRPWFPISMPIQSGSTNENSRSALSLEPRLPPSLPSPRALSLLSSLSARTTDFRLSRSWCWRAFQR